MNSQLCFGLRLGLSACESGVLSSDCSYGQAARITLHGSQSDQKRTRFSLIMLDGSV